MLDTFISWLIPFLCGGAVTFAGTMLIKLKAIKNGLQCLLRAEIIRSYDKYTERGYCPLYAKEALTRAYTAASVVKALNGIERTYGADFYKVFQSITIDNGSEFSDREGLEQSCRRVNNRTKVYYCHPYSAYERGSNENQNKMIRRHYPKGVSFEKVTPADTRKLEQWINNYPRGIFNFSTSADLYEACINSLLSA